MGKVIFRKGRIVSIDSKQISLLKKLLHESPDKKARICLHSSFANALQEMLIIHGCGAYVRPHKHIKKDESISIIEGRGLLVIFSQKGKIKKVLPLSARSGKGNFVCRVNKGLWHSLVILSDALIFHEVSAGPFMGENENVFPVWAPSNEKIYEVKRFLKRISAVGDDYEK